LMSGADWQRMHVCSLSLKGQMRSCRWKRQSAAFKQQKVIFERSCNLIRFQWYKSSQFAAQFSCKRKIRYTKSFYQGEKSLL
jgi:hypothetical protein